VLASPGDARGYTFGPNVKQLGPEETVFDWSSQHCDNLNVPDTPARAFKDSSGQVQLTLSSTPNRRMIGPSLNSLAVDCTVTFSSDANADPSTYDDQEWLHSVYTLDGTKVVALVHEEYHGWDHPGQCNSQGNPLRPKPSTFPSPLAGFDPTCWYNSITIATSTDSGLTYTHVTPPAQLAASVPYTYLPNTGPYGYFSPSNIIRKSDGYYYAIFYAEPYGVQQIGDCIMRAKNPASPASWKAWDGTGYNVQFIDPYTNPGPPDTHVCAPISFTQIQRMHESVTLSSYFGKYLLVGTEGFYDPGTGKTTYGVWYSTSTDLVNWSQAQLLMEAELPWSYQCGDDNPILYPVVLNPASTDRNFGTTGQKTYLYFTRLNYQNCVLTDDRDLIRIPIQFLSPTATGH
jgi:hypothetical protein